MPAWALFTTAWCGWKLRFIRRPWPWSSLLWVKGSRFEQTCCSLQKICASGSQLQCCSVIAITQQAIYVVLQVIKALWFQFKVVEGEECKSAKNNQNRCLCVLYGFMAVYNLFYCIVSSLPLASCTDCLSCLITNTCTGREHFIAVMSVITVASLRVRVCMFAGGRLHPVRHVRRGLDSPHLASQRRPARLPVRRLRALIPLHRHGNYPLAHLPTHWQVW